MPTAIRYANTAGGISMETTANKRGMSRGAQVLAITSIATFLVSLDTSIVNVAFRDIVTHFGDDKRSLLSWIFSGYNIAYAAGLLTAGRFADVFGRKRSFMRGLAIFTIGSVLCGLAPSAFLLVVFRVVQAIGGAMLTPASLALVMPEFPVEKRAAAIGIWGAVGGLAAAFGPIIGGVLVDTFSWRSLFFINVPFCAAALYLGGRHLHESIDESAHRHIDIAAAVPAFVGVGLVVYGIVQSEEWGWVSSGVLGSFAVAVVLLSFFIYRCNGQQNPILDLSLFKLPFVVAANIGSIFFTLAFTAMFFTNTQWLQQVWGYSTSKSGMAFVPGPLTAAIIAAPAGRLAQRVGHARIAALGGLLLSVGTFGYSRFITVEPNYVTRVLPMLFITGAGIGFCISTLSSAASAYLPPTRFAMGSALQSTSRQIASAIGIAFATATLGPALAGLYGGRAMAAAKNVPFDVNAVDLHPFHVSWYAVSICAAMTAVTMLLLYRKPTDEQLAASSAVTFID